MTQTLNTMGLEGGRKVVAVSSLSDYSSLRSTEDRSRSQQPLIESESIDCVLSKRSRDPWQTIDVMNACGDGERCC